MIKASELIARSLPQPQFLKTWEILNQGVSRGVAPGFVAGLWQKSFPDEIWVACTGSHSWDPASPPMKPETVFDLASVTKVLATAPLTALLVERGWISWDSQVSSILPDYPYPKIQIRHLLAHTAGFPAWKPFWKGLWSEFSIPIEQVSIQKRQQAMRNHVYSVPPEVDPDVRCLYSDLSFLLLGFVLEELLGLPLDQAVSRWLWRPMGLDGARYWRVTSAAPSSSVLPLTRVAPTEQCPERKRLLHAQVHDDNCWAMGGYGGHAGAFAPVRDVLHLARQLMCGFLTDSVLVPMWTRQRRPKGCERTLGWDTPSVQSSSCGLRFLPGTVGHLGFTGTSLWIDPQAELAVALLCNRVHPSRENSLMKEFRPQFHEAIRLDLRK
ncbi:MAG: serine hydrolase domain-containing protein [Bdellovibrionia bacterium]